MSANVCIMCFALQEGLFDRNEFITWVVDTFTAKSEHAAELKLLLPLVMQVCALHLRRQWNF